MRALKRAALAFALACSGGTWGSAYAQGGSDATNLRWSADMAERPEFRGVLNKDAAGLGQGQMLYPGGAGLAGLLAGVLTHAAISSSAQTAEMKRLQAKADAVLEPYAGALQALSSDELLLRTREVVALRGWLPGRASLELRPIFLMTQDRRALLMDVVARFSDGNGGPASTVGMRVVSDARAALQDADDWAEADGSGLRRITVALLARAVQHLADHFGKQREPGDVSAPATPERTVRFVEGGSQRMERAAVLEQRCGRALLRTLSNNLMSVPLAATAPTEAGCEAVPAAAAQPAPPAASAATAATAGA